MKAGVRAPSIWTDLKNQVFLGDEHFVEGMQRHIPSERTEDLQVPRRHRRPPPPKLDHLAKKLKNRNKEMAAAHATGEYSYQQIVEHFGVHFTTGGRIVRAEDGLA